MFDQSYTLSYIEIADAFGWEYSELPWDPPSDEFIVMNFWRYITTTGVWDQKSNRVNQITHPCIRYVYRLLNMTIFLKGEVTGVYKDELKLLWALTPEGVGMPNWVDVFVRRCEAVQESKKGKFSFGGMITLLARAVGVTIPTTCPQAQSNASVWYDLHSLANMKSIEMRDGRICHVMGDRKIQLPQSWRFTISATDRNEDLYADTTSQHVLDRPREEESDPNDEEEEDSESDDDDNDDVEIGEGGGEQGGTSGAGPSSTDFNAFSWREDMMARMDSYEQRFDEFQGQVNTRFDRIDTSIQQFTTSYAGDMFNLQNQMQSLWQAQTLHLPPHERERLEQEEQARAQQQRDAYVAQQRAQWFSHYPGFNPGPF